MLSNNLVWEFLINHLLFIGILFFTLLRVVPSWWSQPKEMADKDPKMTLITFVLGTLVDSLSRSCFGLLALFGLQKMVTLIIFVVVIFDVFVKGQISTQAVTLVAVGILALYLDELVKTGKKISFFGIFTWERKD